MLKMVVQLSDGNNTTKLIGERIANAVARTIALKPLTTFEDQFNDGSVDLSKWNPIGTYSESGGQFRVHGNGNFNSGGITSDNSFPVVNAVLEFKVTKQGSLSSFGFDASSTLNALGGQNKFKILFFLNDIYVVVNSSTGSRINTGFDYVENDSYVVTIEKTYLGWNLYIQSDDDSNYTNKTLIYEAAASHTTNMYIQGDVPNTPDFELDYVTLTTGVYPSDSPSPVPAWTASDFLITMDMTSFDVAENNNIGDAGSIEYKYAFNGDALNLTWLTQTQMKALGIITITDLTQSVKFVARYISDGTQKATTDAFATVDIASSSGDQALEIDVRFGVKYENLTKTGTAHIPIAADTREGALTDDTVGTLAIAGPDNVRENIPTDDTVGNYVPADEDKYAQNEKYGANGTEFTGSKTVTQFTTCTDVILEEDEILIFEGD